MKLRELIELAKERSSWFTDYRDMDVYDLLKYANDDIRSGIFNGMYKVNIASGTILNEKGYKCGYIDYTTKLYRIPDIGEVILMYNKYVGKIDKIEYHKHGYDAMIWINDVYYQDDPNLSFEMKHPSFNAGTRNF